MPVASNPGASSPEARRGLFDGFEGYRTPTASEYRDVLTHGIVVPDANVLLNLYRYTDQARDDLLSILTRLGECLWVPHQVLVEFWRNRESTLRDPRDTEKTARELSTARERAVSALREWANRVSLPPDRATTLVEALTRGFDTVTEAVRESSDDAALHAARDTSTDAVLQRLGEILDGRVGAPLGEEAYVEAVREGHRRIEAEEPPGYLDKAKDGDGAVGDYLVWEQVVIEAERQRRDVVFVTGDVKDDWWRKDRGEVRGPRLELVMELRRRAGTRLFMLRPTTLLRIAPEALAVSVHDTSVADAERVDRLLSENDADGWTLSAVKSLLDDLSAEAPVQAAVIEQAASNGGSVTREEVYRIAGYPEHRSLRGFTRPINRITQGLRELGVITDDAVDPVVAVYDPLGDNPSMAIGFAIDEDVLPFVVAAGRDEGREGSR